MKIEPVDRGNKKRCGVIKPSSSFTYLFGKRMKCMSIDMFDKILNYLEKRIFTSRYPCWPKEYSFLYYFFSFEIFFPC